MKEGNKRRRRPAMSNENRQNQLVSYAIDLAEKQLIEGTASSQVITHYLKLGTVQAELEMERMQLENELTRAKTESIQSQKHSEEIYEEALKAFRSYNGHGDEDDYDDY